MTTYYCECGNEAIVRVGGTDTKIVSLCVDHFRDWLEEFAALKRKINEAFNVG